MFEVNDYITDKLFVVYMVLITSLDIHIHRYAHYYCRVHFTELASRKLAGKLAFQVLLGMEPSCSLWALSCWDSLG